MRVVTQDRFGGPEVLYVADRPVPKPSPTEIRIRVVGAGVNAVDCGTRAGGGMSDVIGAPPFVLGWEASGVVDAVAPGVTRFAVGDEVIGMPRFPRQAGTHAEFATGPSRHFARKPRSIDHHQAAGLPLAGLTAWQALVETANVGPRQRVLVHAAAGGVGHLAVQIAKARGAEVFGTARATRHEALSDLGVDQAIDYTRTSFESAAADVDVVLDLVGGSYAFRSLDVLLPGGLLVYLPSDTLPDGLAGAAQAKGVRVTSFLVEPNHRGLEGLARLVDEGKLRVVLAERFPLEEAAKAHAMVDRGHTFGKVVLSP
jgi:NADPH:quinone reductase-like Zn-dependent oxidoreductase